MYFVDSKSLKLLSSWLEYVSEVYKEMELAGCTQDRKARDVA
jgi:hypothetical protein